LTVLHGLQAEALVESATAAAPLEAFPTADNKRMWMFAFDCDSDEGNYDAPSEAEWSALPPRFEGKPHLVVRVVEGSNLITRDNGAACDPYVSVSFGTQERRTTTIKRTFAPYFNEILRLPIPEDATGDIQAYVRRNSLSIIVHDKKLLQSRRNMGQVLVSAAGLVRGREMIWKTQLRGDGVTSGNIFICTTAMNFGHEQAQVAAQSRLLRGLNPRIENKDEVVAALAAGADANGVVDDGDVGEAQEDTRKQHHADNMTADASANEPLCWSSDYSLQNSTALDQTIVSGSNFKSPVPYRTPVFSKGVSALQLYSRREGGPGSVTALLAAGADVKAVDAVGRTPLHFATAFCAPSIAQLFIDNGADIGARDLGGRTPLHYAASFRVSSLGEHNRVLDVLLACPGVDVAAVDVDGNTPLHLAAAMGNQTTAQILLDKGAKETTKMKNGRGKMALQEGLFDFLKPVTFNVV
jgi:C2 domain/Ankyrin repeats (3 copies)/Ankyrin repeat